MIKRLSDHILYMPASHETDRPILAAIYGRDRTLIMDAGNSSAHAEQFLNELTAYNLPPIQWLAITHWHWDHIFGIQHMNLPVIAHKKTKHYMERMVDWKWTDEALDQRVKDGVKISFCSENIKKELGENRELEIVLPHIVFEGRLEIDLGNITCVMEHIGGDHAEDSCVLLVKEERVLFLGDCLGPDIYGTERNYTAGKLLPLLDQVDSYQADILVESHGVPLTREELGRDLDEMRLMAKLTHSNEGDAKRILHEFKASLNRELTDFDQKMIDYFVTGYNIEKAAPE